MLKVRSLLLVAVLILSATQTVLAQIVTSDQVSQLISNHQTLDSSQRIDLFSSVFLGIPYQLEPLGEGSNGTFNQEPLYRFDAFDCETFVNTILALALANNFADFKNKLRLITYNGGIVQFTTRSHFPSADWVPNNIQQGFIKDITAQAAGTNQLAISRVLINQQAWYQHLTLDRIKIPQLSSQQRLLKLQQLHALGKSMPNVQTQLAYIPLAELLTNSANNKNNIISRIPNGSIILLVSNNPHWLASLGTANNISHMGFIIWRQNQAYLRAASSLKQAVTDLPLILYLERMQRADPYLQGIALFQAT